MKKDHKKFRQKEMDSLNNPFVPFSVAMVTPFTSDGELYLDGIPSLIEYYKKHGVPALLISGTTGEQHSMTIEERAALFQQVKQAAKNDLILYGGIAAVQTKDAAALAVSAEEAGLDGIMLGFPPYLRISQQEAFAYAEKICSSVHMPIMLYNNPLRTGFGLHTNTVIALAKKFPQIVSLKEAGDSIDISVLKQQLGGAFTILSGSDADIITNNKAGFYGITSIIGNLFPAEIQTIVKSIQSGNKEEGKQLLNKLKPYIETITEIGTLRSIKYLLEKQNIRAGVCRKPLSVLQDEEKARLDRIFSKDLF